MKEVFSCRDLTKKYRGTAILDGLSMDLKEGHVYGLIGKNGAGKTTLLRLILGMSFPDNGSMSLFGETEGAKQRRLRRSAGALVDSGIFSGNMSGKKNLALLCKLKGIAHAKGEAARVLDAVGLSEKAKLPVRVYSIRERAALGIAGALLGSPRFLLLDEPFGGMEPGEARASRELLKRMSEENGVTMLLTASSPVLLDGLATDYLFLHEGKLLQKITAEELHKLCDGYLELEAEGHFEEIPSYIETSFPATRVETAGKGIFHVYGYYGNLQRLSAALTRRGIETIRLEVQGLTLEHYLVHLTGSK